ncbi:AAA family ATPase [Bradyrhizobium sp. USDA 3256]
MDQSFRIGSLQVLWEDTEHVFCRGVCHTSANQTAVLAVVLTAENPSPASLDRLAREFGLIDDLDGAWAVRPLALERSHGRTMLVLEDPGGEPLSKLLGSPLELGRFLALAVGIAAALGKVHECGLIHKDIKPANIMFGSADGSVRITGFGIASRLSRERQPPELPETIAGTFAYMAPEQTGRTNRSIDARSDLYAFGVTLYQMLAGALPFAAADPMEWVHCHIARMPMPPSERLKHIPAAVSAIIMKLLAKTPEERYQTAGGVERDLRHCVAEWGTRRRIDDFPLGQHDTPNRLLIPEKLYGREGEIATLLASFDRIIKSGVPELVLVTGYSGVGKSSVVNELHKAVVPLRGLFASGKFDQYKPDIPYATLVQAFQSLVRPLLGKSKAELARWRHAFLNVLGPNARLVVDLIPELKLVIGDQPPAPELPSQQAQSRFQLVMERFIGVFARPEHPLALFLDDLQWLDAATLDLLEHLLTRSDLRHLMLIGAYRNNEVTPAHPLMRKVEAIKTGGGKVAEITLAPLAPKHLGQLTVDALRCTPERAAPLANLLHEKTAGNPFFVVQFLSSLVDQALLTFDHDGARWSWDLDGIQARGYTDNVIDLMAGKLTRLPVETQNALQQLACLGNVADVKALSIVLGISEDQIDTSLWPARHQELVERMPSAYRFAHDRIQEAAYSRIPEDLRDETHLRIGRLLAARIPSEKREEAIFDIVNQLNRCAPLITSKDERVQVAELNLIAAKRAKASTGYVSALRYLTAGAALLLDDCWERQYELTFALELHRAECEFLTSSPADAEERLSLLVLRALSLPDLAAVTRVRAELYMTAGRSDRAVEVCLEYLRHVGVQWSAHPTKEEVQQEYEQISQWLLHQPVEALLELPRMVDREVSGTIDVLLEAVPPALLTDENLLCLVVCRMANLSRVHGNCDGSCSAFVWLGVILGSHFGDYQTGFRFGKLGLELVEQRGLDRFKARAYLLFGSHVNPWTQHMRTGRSMVRHAFDAAMKVGDLIFAGFSCNDLITSLLATGDRLSDVQREAEAGLAFARHFRFDLVINIIVTQLQLIRTLRGLTPIFGCFNETEFDEEQFEQQLREQPRLSLANCWYSIRKLQARYFAGDYASAVEAASDARRLLWTSSCFEIAEYHFYAGLARAAHCDAVSDTERAQHMGDLASHYHQLRKWAENCPENFESRADLVGAEFARIEDRALDAMNLYEKAICSARTNGFLHDEALASELTARFYAKRGFEIAAHAYLRNARYCYLRWGADGKVQQLDAAYPRLKIEEPAVTATSTIMAPVEHLDLATVLKVSQAVSGEIALERLLETLMRTAIEQAGAERGLLIFSDGGEQRIAAEATTSGDLVTVHLFRDECVAKGMLPESVLRHVLRTRDLVILQDAAAQPPFAADPYIRQRKVRSVLCLPLLNQARVIGVLLLENNLTPNVFAPGRIAVLKLLASQAAISLENTRLYRELAEREAKIRRLVDSDIIGIVIWELDGGLIDANDAFLRMVQYGREELTAGLRWSELTPPEWREAHVLHELEGLKTTGTMQTSEKEFFRKDGSRVPVLLGAAAFEGHPLQAVAFVLDLTERKRSEAAARDSDQRYREVQMELAHANRVATIGQLTGSIAHEVNQPITGMVIAAQTALRRLDRKPPVPEEVRQSFAQIAKYGTRAGAVIGRIRDLIKKEPPREDLLAINGPIREVIELTRGEATKNRISVKAELAEDLPLVRGDQVQLQQVMLNLIINAVEAMSGISDGKRELLISTGKAESGGVLVVVRDSGPGLASATLERIFEAFYTTKTTGLGMGLSICRSIIEAHRGRLWASVNDSRGAKFQFTLPPPDEAVPR